MGNQNQLIKKQSVEQPAQGFTLIELLVVVSLIALLSSIALIAFQSARMKSRDAKRLADMVQMNNALELFFADYHGYPTSSNGAPGGIVPTYAAALPVAPQASDGACVGQNYPSPPAPANFSAINYYYYPTGASYLGPDNLTTVYSDYGVYFCLSEQTANYSQGMHLLTPEGVQ